MSKKSKKVLIVEDDPSSLRLMQKLLMRDGYEVAVATKGQEVLDQIKTVAPDCILMDVLLPDMMGVEVAGRLQDEEDTVDIPIVFMTVTIDLEKDKGDLTIKVYDKEYRAFAKPVHSRKLLSVIRKEINRYVNRNK